MRRRGRKSSPLLPLFMTGIVFTAIISLLLHDVILEGGNGSMQGFVRRALEDDGKKTQVNPEPAPMTTASACLYTMDDNHYLIEWLAYHYHVMNLRNLIITVDPGSLTSPQHVLDRWRDRMNIELWTDEHFLPMDFEREVMRKADGGKDLKLQYHRVRQAEFNLACLREHKQNGRGWTMMIDVDEYMTYNTDLRSFEPGERYIKWDLPPVEEPGSIATLLDQLILPNPDYSKLETACVPLYRRQFSAKESTDSEINALAPYGFDGRNFQTLRWRRFGYSTLNYKTRVGDTCHSHREIPNKVIVDLGRLRMQDLHHPDNQGNPHVPLEICPENVYLHQSQTPLIVNHYMGTIDQWLYRVGDKRGRGYRLARYEDLNLRIGKDLTNQVRPWLRGFVATVGEAEAHRLLEGVGVLEPLPAQTNSKLVEAAAAAAAGNYNKEDSTYKVGDVVQANYHGDGVWSWAEVSAVYSDEYYNVFYLEDCGEEIATFGALLRREGEVSDTRDYEIDLHSLASAGDSK